MPYILRPFLSSWLPIGRAWRSAEPRPYEGYREPCVGRIRSPFYEEEDLPIQRFFRRVPVFSFFVGCHETRVMLAMLALVHVMVPVMVHVMVPVMVPVVVQQVLPVPGPVVGDEQKDAFFVSWKTLS